MKVKNLKEFLIPYVGLKLGFHRFEYLIEGSFFALFPDAPITECSVKVTLELEKKETFFLLQFFIDGKVKTACDRCLEAFHKEIFGDYQCLIKFSDELSKGTNDDDEIQYITREDDYIDIAPLIYDYIILCLPMQLLGCKEAGEEPQCNQEVLKFLKTQEADSDNPDPRWEGLNKLKFNRK